MNRQITSLKFTQMLGIYLSIYLITFFHSFILQTLNNLYQERV